MHLQSLWRSTCPACLASHVFGACTEVYQSPYDSSQHDTVSSCKTLWCDLSAHLRLQVDDGSWAHMVHAYVHLQEGNIVEGEQNITNAMKAALIRRAC